jgi:mRNA interferase HigB
MRLIGTNKLDSISKKHPDCKSWINNWISDVKAAKWKSLNELKDRYPSASILPGNIVIFNVKGNAYRLVVQLAFNSQVVAVKWIGTHSEYDHKKF